MSKHSVRALLISLCCWLASASCLAAEDVEVVAAAFGLFEPGKGGVLNFEPNVVVPHRVEQRYGWVIELKTKRKRVSVREEYVLQLQPQQNAAAAAAGAVAMERRNQVSQRALALVDGRIYGEWAIGPHEPAGRRHLQVFVEGELAGDFEYEVR
jgi:hypothetical protein